MSQSPLLIERVVEEVLRRLRAAAASGATGSLPASMPSGATGSLSASVPRDETAEAAAAAPDGELTVHCRTVTLASLDGRLDKVRRLMVPARAVVTPAVRDELRRKNVALVFGLAACNRPVKSLRLVVVAMGTIVDPAPLVAAMAEQEVEAAYETSDCVIAATDRLAAAVREPGTLGLLLTPYTAAALCLANRQRGVRAVQASDATAVVEAVAAVGANVLVVDPAGRSLFQLKQMAAALCRGGVRECPRVFKERLG
jgi:hypothetical protein